MATIKATDQPSGAVPATPAVANPFSFPRSAISAGILAWVVISLGFWGLKVLMQERPEFAGQPVSGERVEMVQASPSIVARRVTDDVSVVKPMQPVVTDVRFDMAGRRDYRGLRTIMDMAGEVHAQYFLTNAFDEPLFVLFKCPHPTSSSVASLQAGNLRLQASVKGTQENARDAWLWSGMLDGRSGAEIDVSYEAAGLKSAVYRVGDQGGNPVRQLRVAFNGRNLAPVKYESGDGAKSSADESVRWERRDFLAPDFFGATIVEGRNLFASLTQLLEIGPLVSLLFLLTVSAAIFSRQSLTPLQVFTIAACYALYFPLVLYLSTRFSFVTALVIAAAVPGVLLVNYARWLLGGRLGLLGGPIVLALFWIFPTLAAFAGWNRGMVLLCLGVVTLWVLVNLQNRALHPLHRPVAVASLMALLAFPARASAIDGQFVLPVEFAGGMHQTQRAAVQPIVGFQPASYRVRQETNCFRVEAQASFTCLCAGEAPVPLFDGPVYLLESSVDSPETNFAGIFSVTNRLGLFVRNPGSGVLHLSYRVPLEHREGNVRTEVPLLTGGSGSVRLESPRADLQIVTGSLWTRSSDGGASVYDIGTAGEPLLVLEWREQPAPTAPVKPDTAKDFYGIGLTRARNLTVVNSDGSCTHFAEYEMPAAQPGEFRMALPADARLISVSVNGAEIETPAVANRVCRIPLPERQLQQTAHRLSFRIAYPPQRLGFMGTAEMQLPEVFQTAGTMEWVVALPEGFHSQVIASGLDVQKSAPDLSAFGDYGRIVQSREHTFLAKNLAPPGPVGLNLKYWQDVPGISEARAD